MTTWTIRLPWTAPPLSLNDRGHWRGRARLIRMVRNDSTTLARAARVPQCEHIHIQLIYIPRDSRRRDPENLIATQKALIDGLVPLVVPDDTPQYVSWSPPIIAPADPKDPHLRLEITRKEAP
jgi:crossover junction endodeoxyribonuclease RusA